MASASSTPVDQQPGAVSEPTKQLGANEAKLEAEKKELTAKEKELEAEKKELQPEKKRIPRIGSNCLKACHRLDVDLIRTVISLWRLGNS